MKAFLAAVMLACVGVVGAARVLQAVPESENLQAKSTTPYRSVIIRGIPHIRQKPDFCGEACAAMYLRKLGVRTDQDAVFDSAGLNPAFGRGCYTRELQAALKAIGFDVGKTWHRISADNAAEELNAQFAALHADLTKGTPSIICMHYDDRPRTTEHFRLIVGYDAAKDEVLYHEPATAGGGYRRMNRRMLLKLWPLKYDRRRWTVVRMPLKAGRLTIAKTSAGFTDADYAQHVMRLKKKLPHAGFHIKIQKPFVVIGDESPRAVEARSKNTIKWATDRLKALYFRKDPLHILDIWLFKDRDSYLKHTKAIFDDKPTTPFGYYSSRHRALVMNIATGGGTLVHEIVHPFIESNFHGCPSWFNEGLASLYEQCGEKNGCITGYTNWRLRGLQQAVRNGTLPTFKKLCATTTRQFYDEDRGTNYSQARYLCYYLQEKGLLVRYYKAFVKNARTDPTGYKTLKKTLGVTDMAKFQRRWERWVAALK
ncbi:MAG: C39 family peptidase [Planctomycetaceae bacterium]